jgi:hypothetical protein
MSRTLVRRPWRGVAALALCGLFSTAAHATVTLTDGNSSATFNPTSQSGESTWDVDGTNFVNQSWFWGSVSNSAAPASLDTLTNSNLFSSGGLMSATYQGDGFNIVLNVTLTGGSTGSHTSAMTETLTFNNDSGQTKNVHLYEYENFMVNGNPTNTLTMSGSPVNTALQTDPLGASVDVSVTGGAAAPDHYQIGTGDTILNLLNNGTSPVTLSDNGTGPLVGDDNFAFEFDPTIANGGSFQISINKTITGGEVVPLPNAALSGAGLLCLLTGIALTRKAIRVRA